MLQSNKPYQRVDDGIGAGLVTGGLIGGAASAGAVTIAGRTAGKRLSNPQKELMINSYMGYMDDATGKRDLMKRAITGYNDIADDVIGSLGDSRKGKAAKMMFGTGKRRAITAGASIIGSALIGAGIDKANN